MPQRSHHHTRHCPASDNPTQPNNSLALQIPQWKQPDRADWLSYGFILIDWYSWGFMSHLTQYRSFRRRSPSQSLGSVWKKNLTQQKHTHTNQKKCTTTQNKHKKTKARFSRLHDIRPGNREDLFWFWRFINLSIIYLPTYLQPRDPHGVFYIEDDRTTNRQSECDSCNQ